MTAIAHTGEHTGHIFPDDLPLLTEVVEEHALNGIPTLTEIVAESVAVYDQENFAADGVAADDDLLNFLESAKTETSFPGSEGKVISASHEFEQPELSEPELSDEEMRHLMQQIETLIETVLREKLSRDTIFTQKLSQQLEQLQQMAITQAIDELKAELPELLHDALNARPKL